MEKIKFHGTCGPGDQLEVTATLDSLLESAGRVKVEVHVKGQRMVRGALMFFLRAIDSERVQEQRRYLYSLWTRDLSNPPPIL